MLTKRIIPCLDVKGGRVVKGTQFKSHRDAGDPVLVLAALEGLEGPLRGVPHADGPVGQARGDPAVAGDDALHYLVVTTLV